MDIPLMLRTGTSSMVNISDISCIYRETNSNNVMESVIRFKSNNDPVYIIADEETHENILNKILEVQELAVNIYKKRK